MGGMMKKENGGGEVTLPQKRVTYGGITLCAFS